MLDGAPLFTRSQAQDLTGLDAQTLDYLTRLGALKPVAGGGGKGHHRKYDRHQITLGRMLKEASQLGIGGNALAMIAEDFQASVDWFNENGLAEYASAATSLIAYRNGLETEGAFEVNVASPTPPHNVTQRIDNWEHLVAHHQQISPMPEAVVAKCKSISFDEMQRHCDRFLALVSRGDLKTNAGKIFLFKSTSGGWEIDFHEEPKSTCSFITIRLGKIKSELWRQL